MYEALLKGDPKMRSYRALYLDIYNGYLRNRKAGKYDGFKSTFKIVTMGTD